VTKKDVMEAAYWMIISIASSEPDKAAQLQALAISERTPGDELGDEQQPEPRKRSKRNAAQPAELRRS
jgi:hypothetical protein